MNWYIIPVMERGRIGVKLDEQGAVTWNRASDGMSLKDFVANYLCKALKFLAGGGTSTELGDPLLSVMGGRGKLQEFNRDNLCGEEENLIQQI